MLGGIMVEICDRKKGYMIRLDVRDYRDYFYILII